MILSWKYTADGTGNHLRGKRDPYSPFPRRNHNREVVKYMCPRRQQRSGQGPHQSPPLDWATGAHGRQMACGGQQNRWGSEATGSLQSLIHFWASSTGKGGGGPHRLQLCHCSQHSTPSRLQQEPQMPVELIATSVPQPLPCLQPFYC